MTKLIMALAILGLSLPASQACDNNCWLNANAAILVANAQYFHDHPDVALIVDEICMQGRPITQQQINVSNRFGFHNPQECRRATPTPTATQPAATPTPTPTPTATATHTPLPSPTVRPSPSPTAHPSPTRTPTPTATPRVSPTPTPSPSASPTCTPHGNCTLSTVEWRDTPIWPLQTIQIGNNSYTKAQCIQILNGVEDGVNGLGPLAKEVIAASLNRANGAGFDCALSDFTQAQLIIGNLVPPPIGNGFIPLGNVQTLIFHLAGYNKGQSCCASHCNINAPDVEPKPCVNNIEINVPSLIGYTHDQALDKWHETGFTGPMIFDKYGEPLRVAAQSINAGTPTCPTDPIGITMR